MPNLLERNELGQFVKGNYPKVHFKKGNVPWNKGLHIRLNPNGGFQKGYTPWNKGKKCLQLSDENHPQWKGDNVGYHALHDWIRSKLGKPKICEHCNRDGLTGRKIHWANISGNYLRKLDDWIRLCSSCHIKYDKNNHLKSNA